MQLRIALALAMHGSVSGALVIYNEIEKPTEYGFPCRD